MMIISGFPSVFRGKSNDKNTRKTVKKTVKKTRRSSRTRGGCPTPGGGQP